MPERRGELAPPSVLVAADRIGERAAVHERGVGRERAARALEERLACAAERLDLLVDDLVAARAALRGEHGEQAERGSGEAHARLSRPSAVRCLLERVAHRAREIGRSDHLHASALFVGELCGIATRHEHAREAHRARLGDT